MEQGYYETPSGVLYEAACALDNQDVPLEDWPVKLIAALARAGFAVVPTPLGELQREAQERGEYK